MSNVLQFHVEGMKKLKFQGDDMQFLKKGLDNFGDPRKKLTLKKVSNLPQKIFLEISFHERTVIRGCLKMTSDIRRVEKF